MAAKTNARSSRGSRFLSRKVWLVGAGLALALMLAAGDAARAADTTSDFASIPPRLFKICSGQTYALCAVASCFVLNGVSYCTCDVKSGDSISAPFSFDDNQDICSVNAEGAENGYMASTYSLPESVVRPDGDQALYDCPASTSTAPTPSAMAACASPAPLARRFRAPTSP